MKAPKATLLMTTKQSKANLKQSAKRKHPRQLAPEEKPQITLYMTTHKATCPMIAPKATLPMTTPKATLLMTTRKANCQSNALDNQGNSLNEST